MPAGLKWNYYEPDVFCAWVAEMDYGLAPAISRALHAAVDRGDTGYHYPAAEHAVAEAGVAFWKARLGWDVGSDRVFHAPDVVEGLRRAIVHLTRPGSPVVLHTPVYFPFFSMVERADRKIIEVPSPRDDEGQYRLDLEGIDSALAAGAGSVVLCNPWNPVGRSFEVDEIEALLAVIAAHDARLIVDEVHAPLTFDDRPHVVAASLDPERVVTVTAASKAWNIPGLKAAQVILTSDSDVEVWAPYFTPDKVGVGTFGLIASAAAYSEGAEWLDGVMVKLSESRDLLGHLVATHLPEAGYVPPQATYLAWVDCSAYGWDDPGARCLDHSRVAVTDGAQFRGDGEGQVRLNFATSEDNLVEIVRRMSLALANA
jgi:cystathionine beta-lyase